MKGTCILVAVLFIVSTFGTSAYPGASEVPEKEKITENMPSLDNISLFINSIPYEVGNINFGMEKNITIELALKTENINMLLEKNQSWLENAVIDFYTINNINVSSNEMKNFFNKTNALPDGLKKAIALLIYSLNDAILASRNATKNLSSDEINFLRENNETQSDLLSLLKSAIMERMVIFPDAELFSSSIFIFSVLRASSMVIFFSMPKFMLPTSYGMEFMKRDMLSNEGIFSVIFSFSGTSDAPG